MPITVAEGTRALRAYGVQRRGVSHQTVLGKAAVSQFGRDVQIARHALEALPDEREDRIAAIRKRLAEGGGISTEAIAEKIIFQGIADRLR